MTKNPKIETFKALLAAAKRGRDPAFDQIPLWRAQYGGSHDIDGGAPAPVVRNITYELIESQVSTAIPAPRVDPEVLTPRHEKNARAVEELCLSLRNKLQIERINDLDERTTYIEGGDLFFAAWDEQSGGVRLSAMSAYDFFPQPGVFAVEDMDWMILRFYATREELLQKYGKAPEPAPEETGPLPLYLCLYRGTGRDIGLFLWSEDVVLADLPDYYARRRRVCVRCGATAAGETCSCGGKTVERHDVCETLTAPVTVGQGESAVTLPAGTRLPWYKPRHYPVVVRKNTSRHSSVLGQSDCAFIRCHQQEINKIESRIHEKLLSSGVFAVKPEGVSFEYDNTVGERVLNVPREHSAADFGTVDTTPDVSQEQAQSDRLYDQAKRLLGITDTYQGQADATAASGVAKEAQIKQAAGRLDSKRVMKSAAYADLDRVFFELYLAFADGKLPLTSTDALGRRQADAFDRYQFLEPDGQGGWRYHDGYLFAADLAGGAEQSREALWRINRENLATGALGDPKDPRTLLCYWRQQERARYPAARQNVAYFEQICRETGGNGARNTTGEGVRA